MAINGLIASCVYPEGNILLYAHQRRFLFKALLLA
jgi:hypothetical protein